MTLNRLQIDNHGQLTPLYPVLLKPKSTSLKVKKDDQSLENAQPTVQVYVSIKQNIPNVQYINWLEFLFAELELRIEVDHLMSIFQFAEAFNKNFAKGLTSSHQIFNPSKLTTVQEVDTRPEMEESKDVDLAAINVGPLVDPDNQKSVRFDES